MSTTPVPVLFYDGECGLCTALMRFILKRDRRGVLHFAPLQGATAQAFLRARGLPTADFDSIVFVEDLGRPNTDYWFRTAGVLRALAEMGGGWRRVAQVLRLVPASWRDAIYRVVARVRYRVFGRGRPTGPLDPRWAGRVLE